MQKYSASNAPCRFATLSGKMVALGADYYCTQQGFTKGYRVIPFFSYI